MDEEFEMDIDYLIEYLDFEKFRGPSKITRYDAIMMVESAFDEAESEARSEEDNEEDD